MPRAGHTGALCLLGGHWENFFLRTTLFLSTAAGIISYLKLLSRFQEELMPGKMSAQHKSKL